MSEPTPAEHAAIVRPIAWRVRTTPGHYIELTLVGSKGEAHVSRTFDPQEIEDIQAAIEDALLAIVTGGRMERGI